MNVICILGGWLLLWEKSKRDCGEGEGGSVKKEGKIFPRTPAHPCPSPSSPKCSFSSPSFPPFFPPRGLPASPFRRTHKANHRWLGLARRGASFPASPPSPPLISPSNSILAPVPGALACRGLRPCPSPPCGCMRAEAGAGGGKKGGSHHFRQLTCKMADCLGLALATRAAAFRRHRWHGMGPARGAPAATASPPGARLPGAHPGLGPGDFWDFPFPAGAGASQPRDPPAAREAPTHAPKSASFHLLSGFCSGNGTKGSSIIFSDRIFKKLLLKMPSVPLGDIVGVEAWLQNFFLDALDDVSFFVYCDNISETAV